MAKIDEDEEEDEVVGAGGDVKLRVKWWDEEENEVIGEDIKMQMMHMRVMDEENKEHEEVAGDV